MLLFRKGLVSGQGTQIQCNGAILSHKEGLGDRDWVTGRQLRLTAFDLGSAHHLPLPVKVSRGS